MPETTHSRAEGAETMTAGQSLDLRDLHAANIARQAEWCPDQVPDLSFRGNELGGECGEAQNVIKKLERERQGWRGSRATKDDLADELADVVICADLCAVTAEIDLGAAVRRKFNATSEKQGLSVFLPLPPRRPPPVREGAEMGETAARATCATCRHMHREPQMCREGGREWQISEKQWCARYPKWQQVGSHLMSTKPRPTGPNHWCGEHSEASA